METVPFILQFAEGGDLSKVISELKEVNELYHQLGTQVTDVNKKIVSSSDPKEISELTNEVGRLQKEYNQLTKDVDALNKKKKESKVIDDKDLEAQVRKQQKLNEQRKAIRELIKDETALTLAQQKQVKSLDDLNKQTAALIRIRSKLDISTKEGQKEFDSLTQKIKANTDAQKKFGDQIGRSQLHVGDYQQAFKGLAGTILTVTGATVGLSAVGSFVRDSTAAFREFDGQLKETSAITGITGETLDNLKAKALEVGSSSRTGASEYLDAVKIIASAKPELLSNAEGLQLVADKAILLSEASGMDLPTATASLTDAMNQFGASAEEAGKFVDTLAAGAKFGSAEVPDITEALLKMGLVAKSSNISLQESVATIEALAERGLKGAESGTQLRNVLLKLSATRALPRTAIAELKAAGVDMDKLSDKSLSLNERLEELSKIAQNDTAIVKVFGTENVVAAKAILNNRDRIAELTKAVDTNGVALEQASVNNQSAAAQAEILENKLEAVQIQVGEKLTPTMNGLKATLIDLLDGFVDITDGLSDFLLKQYDVNAAMLGMPTTAAIEQNKKLAESVNNLSAKSKNLAKEMINQSKTESELINKSSALNFAFSVLDKSTGKTKETYNQLNNFIDKGVISLDEYMKGIQKLTGAQNTLKDIMAGSLQLTKEQSEEMEALSKKELEDAKKAFDDAYQQQLKAIELEKTLEETAIERSVNDAEEKSTLKLMVDKSYLEKKLVLDQTYNKDAEKTELELVQKKNQIRDKELEEHKKMLQKKIDIQNQLDEIEFNQIKDAEQKAIVSEQRILEKKLEDLQKAGIKSTELEQALTRETETKIAAIREEFRKKRTDEDVKAIDRYYKELELNAVESGMTNEQLQNELTQNEIDRLEEIIQKRQEAGEDTVDLEIELAQKRRAIKEKEAEEDKKRIQEGIRLVKDSFDVISAAYSDALDKKIEQDEKEIDQQQSNVERQEELAERGLENTLAFEKEALIEKRKQLLEDQKKQQKLKEIETFFNLLAAYSEKDPNTAAVKAFAQLQISKAIAARLEHGGIISDEVAKQNRGILRGPSHKKGGILIEAEGEEGIFSRKEMANFGRENFYSLKEALKNPVPNGYFSKQNDDVTRLIAVNNNPKFDLSPIRNELREIKKSVDDKPVPSMVIDKEGNLITTHTAHAVIKRVIHKSGKRSFNN